MKNFTDFSAPIDDFHASCWHLVLSGVDHKDRVKHVVLSILFLVVAISTITSLWSVVVILWNDKLRKPTWIFKASMAVKDLILCIAMATYTVWTVIASTETHYIQNKQQSYFNIIEFLFNVVFITCVSSSFAHVLLISFDRHQVMSRPFRYHTGELLPTKVAWVLLLSSWTFCFVIGLSVTSQTLEAAERQGSLLYTGTLYPLYRLPILQKLLLGGGMALLYFITVGLLCASLFIDKNRAKVRKEQLLNGIGDPEPLRSRNNSMCHPSGRKKSTNQVFEDNGNNSEADANDFLMSGGGGFSGPGTNSEDLDETKVQQVTIFTPVNYRPSLLRRIRDTWSLYSAIFCFFAFTLLSAIPFLVLVLVDIPETMLPGSPRNSSNDYGKSTSYCIVAIVMEYLILLQGFCYITIYLIIDDVFRPFFLWRFTALYHRLRHDRRQLGRTHNTIVKRDSKRLRLVPIKL